MELTWTPEQQAFRRRVLAFLAAELPADWIHKSQLDASSEYVTEFSRRFCPKLAEAGLLTPHWPAAYGGADADPWSHWMLNEELIAVGEPRGYQYMSVNWVGPAVIRFGTDEQKSEHLSRISRGEVFYCQGFSEPGAGSDLAALQLSGKRQGDRWILNGQKIWTSAASFADYCVLLARTGERRKDITVFLVPMDSSGVTVRVIKGLQGQRAFHEMFFDDVALPETAILGRIDHGWEVVTAILHNERIGMPRYMIALRGLEHAVAWLERTRNFDAVAQFRAAEARAACEAARLQAYKVIDARVKGQPPSAETSLARYAMVLADRKVAELIGDLCSACLISNVDPVVSAAYRRATATGIASGTAEMQLNLIAREHLGLPKAS